MFEEIEKWVHSQLARAQRMIGAQATLNNTIWDDFNLMLEQCIYTATCLAEKQYSLHDRLPSQELINKIQLLNERLTLLHYGSSNINRTHLFLIKLHEEAGLLAYPAHDFLITQKKDSRQEVSTFDTAIRHDKKIRKDFSNMQMNHLQYYTPLNLSYGKNPLEKIYPPKIITAEQNRVYLSRAGLMRVGLKLLQKRQQKILDILNKNKKNIVELKNMGIDDESPAYVLLKKYGKIIENWGQVDPVTAERWLKQIKNEEVDIHDKQVKLALFYLEKPRSPLFSTQQDAEIIEQGVASKILVRKTGLSLDNQLHMRYLNFSWTRENDFIYVDSTERVSVARHKGCREHQRVMPNHFPYYGSHGLVVAGTPDNLRDPQAHQPNTRLDIEMLHKMLAFFNPGLNQDTLPGEKKLFICQHPRVSSSVLATGHGHLAEMDTETLSFFKAPLIRQHYLSCYEILNVLQLGKDRDSLILDITHLETHEDLLGSISSLMNSLNKNFAGSGIDMSIVCFPANGVFHTLIIPMSKLISDDKNEMLYNARGQSDRSLGISVYHSNPHPILGIFRMRYDNKIENEVLSKGKQAVEIYADFIALEGLRNHLDDYLNTLDNQARVQSKAKTSSMCFF